MEQFLSYIRIFIRLSTALPGKDTTARAVAARPPPLCGGEGVIEGRISFVSKGDGVPLGQF